MSAFILSALFFAYRGYKNGAPWGSTGREWTDVSGIGDADGGGRGVVVARQMAIETIECGIWFLVSCCAFCYVSVLLKSSKTFDIQIISVILTKL